MGLFWDFSLDFPRGGSKFEEQELNMKVELKLYQKKTKVVDGKYPVYLYIYENAKQFGYFGIQKLLGQDGGPIRYSPEEFTRIRQYNQSRDRIDRIRLQTFEDRIKDLVRERQLKTKDSVIEMLDMLNPSLEMTLFDNPFDDAQSQTLRTVIEEKINVLRKGNRSISEYSILLNKLDLFSKKHNPRSPKSLLDFPLEQLGNNVESLVKKFKDFLGEVKPDGKVLSEASVNSYLRQFRAILNIAKLDYGKSFSGCSTNIRAVKKHALTPPYLKKLWSTDFEAESETWAVNLAFLSYFLGGANLKDLINLKKSDHYIDGEGNSVICFIREKTKRTQKVLVTYLFRNEIRKVLDYFQNTNPHSSYLFDLTPPSVVLKVNLGDSTLSKYASAWNHIAQQHLRKVFQRDGIEVKASMKMIRISTFNITFRESRAISEDQNLAVKALGDTKEMVYNYVVEETELNTAKIIAKVLLEAVKTP